MDIRMNECFRIIPEFSILRLSIESQPQNAEFWLMIITSLIYFLCIYGQLNFI